MDLLVVPYGKKCILMLLHPLPDEMPEGDIASDNYVVHTLEAALWCLLTTSSCSQAAHKAA